MEHRPEVTTAGVDTFKFASYVADDRTVRAIEHFGTRAAGGGARLVELGLDDAAVLFYPATSLLAVEGHPGGKGHLANADDVPGWVEDVRDELRVRGIRLDDAVGVARCDAAVNLTAAAATGAAILAGAAAVIPPRMKLDTFRSAQGIETVYYVTPKGQKRARIYDWGLAHGEAARLTNLRAEDQRRYDRPSRRPDARTTSTDAVRADFRGRFGALAKATRGVTVASVPVMVDKLGTLYERDELTWAQAERAIGYVMLARSGARPAARNTEWRRRSELQKLGLVLQEGELQAVEVDLGEVYERVLDEASW